MMDGQAATSRDDAEVTLSGEQVTREGPQPALSRTAHQAADASPDPDDGRLLCTRFPRTALFGIGDRLAALHSTSRRLAAQPASLGSYSDPAHRLVAEHLDREYYLAKYPDVAAAGIDPVHHYCNNGWTEHRQPSAWFDTAHYLRANADVQALGVNPFWHYLAAGRVEGRQPRRSGDHRRSIIEAARDPDDITAHDDRSPDAAGIPAARIEEILRDATRGMIGLAISLSHDCYLTATGGIQVFIADEQLKFSQQKIGYLNISPARRLLRLADPGDRDRTLTLVLDGVRLGVTSVGELAKALRRVKPAKGQRQLFIVHCLLGHNAADVIDLQQASAATRNIFWVHDYSSICTGYTLLRNNAAYCGAPPAGSNACMVCIYGARRAIHTEQVRSLFEKIAFDVVAPSRAALQIWQAHAGLPYATARVHEHCTVQAGPRPTARLPAAAPARVAFIGYPVPHKGWQLFQDLVTRTDHLRVYDFIHLGNRETAGHGHPMRHHTAITTADEPMGMVRAIEHLRVDIVLVLSTWPETFSYVTYEAMAGGADIVCLGDSGNVADAVLRHGRGIVAADDDALFALFESLRLAEYVRLCRETGTPQCQLVRNGTSATLPLDAAS